jgi:hypothetical protein
VFPFAHFRKVNVLGVRWAVAEIAVEVAAITGLDNLKALGNAIQLHRPRQAIRHRKRGCAGLSALRTPNIFNPMVAVGHPGNMRQSFMICPLLDMSVL